MRGKRKGGSCNFGGNESDENKVAEEEKGG
jgi:hypothetical protein